MPPTALPTADTVSAWLPSLAGPALSLPVSTANAIVRLPESSAIALSASSTAVGASFTSPTVTVTVAVSVSVPSLTV